MVVLITILGRLTESIAAEYPGPSAEDARTRLDG
jgi:hypothetical protein